MLLQLYVTCDSFSQQIKKPAQSPNDQEFRADVKTIKENFFDDSGIIVRLLQKNDERYAFPVPTKKNPRIV